MIIAFKKIAAHKNRKMNQRGNKRIGPIREKGFRNKPQQRKLHIL